MRDLITVGKRLKLERYLQIFREIGNKDPMFRESVPAETDLHIEYFQLTSISSQNATRWTDMDEIILVNIQS
jgi:hypothetical protein